MYRAGEASIAKMAQPRTSFIHAVWRESQFEHEPFFRANFELRSPVCKPGFTIFVEFGRILAILEAKVSRRLCKLVGYCRVSRFVEFAVGVQSFRFELFIEFIVIELTNGHSRSCSIVIELTNGY
jgi:hypothetical protein